MNTEQQIATENQITPVNPKNKKGSIVLFILIGLVCAIGAGYGGYTYGSNINNMAINEESTSTSEPAPATFHTVIAKGSPYGTNKTITTKLAVPNRLQSVAISSSIQDPGYVGILANKLNDEMGRWILGNPTLADRSRTGEISILHIGDDWLAETTTDKDIVGDSIEEYDFTSPAEKASTLNQLKSATVECAKDSEKGFTLSGSFNVCYSAKHLRQASGSYAPLLNLKGYGDIEGRAYVLFGYISLDDGTEYGEQEANKKGDEFAAGNIPAETKSLIAEYVNALKNSTIISSAR